MLISSFSVWPFFLVHLIPDKSPLASEKLSFGPLYIKGITLHISLKIIICSFGILRAQFFVISTKKYAFIFL